MAGSHIIPPLSSIHLPVLTEMCLHGDDVSLDQLPKKTFLVDVVPSYIARCRFSPAEFDPSKESLVFTPFVVCMSSCHSLTNINGELSGDPLDLKMFNTTGWVGHVTLELPFRH